MSKPFVSKIQNLMDEEATSVTAAKRKHLNRIPEETLKSYAIETASGRPRRRQPRIVSFDMDMKAFVEQTGYGKKGRRE